MSQLGGGRAASRAQARETRQLNGQAMAMRREGMRQLGRCVVLLMSQRQKAGIAGSPPWMSKRLARVAGNKSSKVDWSVPQSASTSNWFVKVGATLMRDLVDDPDLQRLLPPQVAAQPLLAGYESHLRNSSAWMQGRIPAPPSAPVVGREVSR